MFTPPRRFKRKGTRPRETRKQESQARRCLESGPRKDRRCARATHERKSSETAQTGACHGKLMHVTDN
eukprot:2214522-Alexandrium_andersonii.AAC.1